MVDLKNLKSEKQKMSKKHLSKEWRRLNFEIFENKPKTDKPYPPDVVKKRELLLYAQVHLAEISWAKRCKDWETERLHTEAYNLVMQKYYEWEGQKDTIPSN